MQDELGEYLRHLRESESLNDFRPAWGIMVEKEKIAANGDYNLSGERYRESELYATQWPMVSLDKIADFESGSRQKGGAVNAGIPSIGGEQIDEKGNIRFERMKFISEDHFRGMNKGILKNGDVLVVKDGATTGKAGFFPYNWPAAVNEHVFILRARESVDCYYLYSVVRSDAFQEELKPFIKGIIGGISLEVRQIQIPLPPLEIQQEIAAEIDGYQKVINGARAVVENYRPHIVVDLEWPTVALGDVCERFQYGLSTPLNTQNSGYKTFRMNELVEGRSVDSGDMKYADISAEQFEKYRLVRGDILFNRTNSIEHVGRTGIFDLEGPYCFASYLIRLSIDGKTANPFYVNAFMNTEKFQSGIKQYASRAIGQSNINAKSLAAYCIPLPPISVQNSVIAELDAEQALIEANRELICRFEYKVQEAIARVWRA